MFIHLFIYSFIYFLFLYTTETYSNLLPRKLTCPLKESACKHCKTILSFSDAFLHFGFLPPQQKHPNKTTPLGAYTAVTLAQGECTRLSL